MKHPIPNLRERCPHRSSSVFCPISHYAAAGVDFAKNQHLLINLLLRRNNAQNLKIIDLALKFLMHARLPCAATKSKTSR
jgi:hypothetical protein